MAYDDGGAVPISGGNGAVSESITLGDLDDRSRKRYKKLKKHIDFKSEQSKEGVTNMGISENIDSIGGGGFGGGNILTGLLVGALLGNRNGLFGGADGGSAMNGLQSSIDTNTILQSLGDIKAAVPLAESQVQTALAIAQGDITSQNQAQTLALSSASLEPKKPASTLPPTTP